MSTHRNNLGQPIGQPLPLWQPPPRPSRTTQVGQWCRLEPLDANRHSQELFRANSDDHDGGSWTYMAYGPFADFVAYHQWLECQARELDPLFFTIIDAHSGLPSGVASYLRITPQSGSIEIGHIHFSPRLQRSPAATEALFLLLEGAFSLGYRRVEWKCDVCNAPSRAAAERLGLRFEGVFRQATVYKGRNRDTAWYATIDSEWPALQGAFQRWLKPDNFDDLGQQRTRLSDLTRTALNHLAS
jgi:RimJ/RimL family protein N-acetyltransferase